MKLLFNLIVYLEDYTLLFVLRLILYLLMPLKSVQWIEKLSNGMAAVGVVNGLPSSLSHSRIIVSDMSHYLHTCLHAQVQ